MKKLVLLLCLTVIIFSCKKKDQYGIHQPTKDYRRAPTVFIDTASVSGIMVLNKFEPHNTVLAYAEQWGWFYDDAHSRYIPMNIVQFNKHNLLQAHQDIHDFNDVIYPAYLYNSEINLTIDSIHWEVRDTTDHILLDYVHFSHFPECINVVPDSANWSTGLSLQFDSTTVKGADSVYLWINAGSGFGYISKIVSTQYGTLKLDLSDLHQHTDKIYVTLTAFTNTVQTFNGRSYAFIKQDISYYSINMTQ